MNLDHLNDVTLWVAIHENRYGLSIFPFTTGTKTAIPTIEQVVEACNIDYEPKLNEYITLCTLSLNKDSVPHIGD